jgi:hypothetical protein
VRGVGRRGREWGARGRNGSMCAHMNKYKKIIKKKKKSSLQWYRTITQKKKE